MNKELKRVLVVLPIDTAQKYKLEEAMPDAEYIYHSVHDLNETILTDVHIIIGNIPIPLLEHAKKLEWLQLNNAGTEGYTTKGVLPENAILTNATGAYGGIISEHMIGMLLMLQKNLHKYYDNKKDHNWQREGHVLSIEGSTTLIIGLGDIGGTFARKMKALGSYTIGIKRRDLTKPEYIDEIYHISDLKEQILKADIVALCLPGYSQTYHIIDEEMLKSMKEDAILINVGRGSAIDTKALMNVLETGHLKGVCLDVTEIEPLPKEHHLWEFDNVLITPHVSGPYRQKEALDKIVDISAENLKRYSSGIALINEIDLDTGYCK